MIVQFIESGDYGNLIKKLLTPGRFFYVTYQGILYYYTGITVISILAINALMAFWGGLILTRLLYSFSSIRPPRRAILPLFLIFVPSVVFWSAANLKEALTYWSICQIVNLLLPRGSRGEAIINFGLFIIGVCIGALLRPHIIVIWLSAVLIVKMFQPHFWKYMIFVILLSPVFLPQIDTGGRLSRFCKDPIATFIEQKRSAERKYEQFVMRAKTRSTIRSTFTYGEGLPVPVLHGSINILFRPFLWQTRNLRSMLTGIEIWVISLCIIFVWMRMRVTEWRRVFRNPLVWVAMLVSIPFFFFFTYTPNEGWIARQRIQMFPALLIMISIPIFQRRYYISKGIIKNHLFRKTTHIG